MTEKEKKVITKISVAGLIGIFATCFLYMADLSFYPIFGTLMEEFPNASNFIMNTAITGSQCFVAIASLAVIPLMKRYSKKKLLIISILIFIVFACSCQFINDITLLAVFRALSGLGFGGTFPLVAALINQVYFSDKNKRDRYIGWLSGIMGVTGIINSLMAGVLAVISWHAVFAWYWIAVPVLLLVIFCVPSTPADKDDPNAIASEKAQAEAIAKSEAKPLPVGSFVAMLLAFVVSNIGWFDVATQLSVYLPEHFAVGATTASNVQAVGTIAAFIIGFCFAPLFHKLKRFFPMVVFGCFGVCYLIYFLAAPMWLLCAGIFLAGVAYAGGMSYYMVYAATILPASKEATGMALVTVAMAVGGLLAPYVVNWVEAIMGVSTITPTFLWFAIAMFIATALSLILAIRSTRKGEGIGDVAPAPEQDPAAEQ